MTFNFLQVFIYTISQQGVSIHEIDVALVVYLIKYNAIQYSSAHVSETCNILHCVDGETQSFHLKVLKISLVLFWGYWYPCFGFLVTSPLGFKARVGSALFALQRLM